MISFAGVSQLAPAFLGGLFWTGANRKGAVAGIVTGFVLWALLLPFPLLAQAGLLPAGFIDSGYFGISWLQPFHLFGMQEMDAVTNGAFWSLFFNTLVFVMVSIYAQPEIQELSQADFFVNFKKYFKGQHEPEVVRREARMEDVVFLLHKFLGEERTQHALSSYGKGRGINTNMMVKADSDLVNYVETILSGALGAPSARLVIDSIAKSAPISLDELVAILNQTQEIMEYSKALEVKSRQLEETTHSLQAANQQLLELDQLKADFITTVTHELRTPVTSIKALARILFDHPELEIARRDQYLDIIVQESERITRLINQVLDIEKIQSHQSTNRELVDINALAEIAAATVVELMTEKEIVLEMNLGEAPVQVMGQRDRIMQVLINLLGNAIKFCPEHDGHIVLSVSKMDSRAVLSVIDNGIGIKEEDQKKLFEKFSQLHDGIGGKPGGSGLGLYICKQIVEAHGGRIAVESSFGQGASFTVEWPLAEG
jgi:signal transduction histidine kinase